MRKTNGIALLNPGRVKRVELRGPEEPGSTWKSVSVVIAETAVATGSPVPSSGRTTARPQLLPPRCPASLRETGLTVSQLANFILKSLYFSGARAEDDIARELRLPVAILADSVQFLEGQGCLTVTREESPQSPARLALTDPGRGRARDALNDCRYLGPAPVSLSSYIEQCHRQAPERITYSVEQIRTAFEHLVIPDALFAELGTAVCDGRSILLYGATGNGKTQLARAVGRLLQVCGGEIYVPYAIQFQDSIVTVLDPAIHLAGEASGADSTSPTEETGEFEVESGVDPRWRRVRRPVVFAGTGLTPDMLDLQRHDPGNYYTAPQHVKANGGVFVIDDFGRQIIGSRELSHRWRLPIEEAIDPLTLADGRQFEMPIRHLVVFITNLNPHDLVDAAFLRRIRHRIRVPDPTRDIYEGIFRNCCRQRDFEFESQFVDTLFERYYNRQRLPRSCDPHDLLEMVASVCRFRGEDPRLDAERLRLASDLFFRDV